MPRIMTPKLACAQRFGRYFGYPECCIETFLDELSEQGRDARRLPDERMRDGVVFCPACAARPREEVDAEIATRRRHHEPFPTSTISPDMLETFIHLDGLAFTFECKAALEAHLKVKKWGLWCTLYTDASNAGSTANGPRGWAWGARARIDDEVCSIFDVPAYLTGAGDSPEAGSLSSNVGELWAIVHGVAMVLERWPFVRGIGIRSDNQAACWAVEGCDVRSRFVRHGGKKAQPMDDARERLAELLRPRRVLIRASHVRGHNRAEHAPQRAFNQQADQLARRHATRSNGGR